MRSFVIISLCIAPIWSSFPRNGPIEPAPLRAIGPRIVNGNEASLGQFPWQVGIMGYEPSTGNYFCGGSIISEEWILTAGHCVYGATSADIYTGTVRINDPNRVTSKAARFVVHENYNSPGTLNNDIGLIQLAQPLTFNDNTKPIALAIRDPQVGTNVTVSGWGIRSDSDLYVSNELYFTEVATIENDDCSLLYGTSVIIPGVVCASPGNPHSSPCQGDSGAPVVVMNSCNKPVQVAVFSFVNGYGCEFPYPSGNTRVAYYRNWIREVTGV